MPRAAVGDSRFDPGLSRLRPEPAGPLLTWSDRRFFKGGEQHQILAGAMHYFRIHPDQWRDRMTRLQDLGLNTVDTYIPWSFHQPRAGIAPDFTGWRDVGRFIETAADLGLDVILRPGPYICAEWSNGGLPVWLSARGASLRSSDPQFLGPVKEWFSVLLAQLTPYQASAGGPVVAFQVENEYGSYGDDSAYLGWIVEQLRGHGVTELLYTADGPTDVMLDGGMVPGVLAALTLGSRPQKARDLVRLRRADEPFFCAEFWIGWFDHWGQSHHVRSTSSAASTLEAIIADGGSVSIYMAHGGTNFGLSAGANVVDGEVRSTVTSYDSDAPIAEDGTLTEKFFAIRSVLGADTPPRSAQPKFLEPRALPTLPGASLAAALPLMAEPASNHLEPPSFDALGLDSGLVRYEATVAVPNHPVVMHFERVADRALVFLDGRYVGSVTGSGSVELEGQGRDCQLVVLVEGLGRINYGPRLGEAKGLTGTVLLERRRVYRWSAQTIDIEAMGTRQLEALAEAAPASEPHGPGFATAEFELDEPLDTHLALPGFVKGFVWINGFLLGRYSNDGPQRTLYVPSPLLSSGLNRICVLELENRGAQLELRAQSDLGEPMHFVEEF